jgi:hypothetical protein
MAGSLADVSGVLNDLRTEGAVEKYAVGGAMAMVFWAEPTVTFDLDVFVFLPPTSSPIVSLEPLYGVVRARGFEPTGEHVMIHGVPVQSLGSPGELADEAIETAVEQRFEDVPFRVMDPERQVRDWTMRAAAPRLRRARPSQALLDRQRDEKARWRSARSARR